MTPARYRKGGQGTTIRFGFGSTALGRTMIAVTDRGVCALRFGADEQTTAELMEEFPGADLVRDDSAIAGALAAVEQYLAGTVGNLQLPMDAGGTDFQRRVWNALCQIPAGETRSYGQVAESIGQPAAVRAVARACASNPVALMIPCHRVIRASGELSGYRWGIDRKRLLLEWERDDRLRSQRLSHAAGHRDG